MEFGAAEAAEFARQGTRVKGETRRSSTEIKNRGAFMFWLNTKLHMYIARFFKFRKRTATGSCELSGNPQGHIIRRHGHSEQPGRSDLA